LWTGQSNIAVNFSSMNIMWFGTAGGELIRKQTGPLHPIVIRRLVLLLGDWREAPHSGVDSLA